MRGVRIGRRLYEERRALAERLELTGIAFAGRMPGYSRVRRKVGSPEDYLEQVIAGKAHDPVLRFQLLPDMVEDDLGILDLEVRRRDG